jgi:hypothetical protein
MSQFKVNLCDECQTVAHCLKHGCIPKVNPNHVVEVTPEELEDWNKMTTALDKQVGGNHYKDLPIQPIEYIHANAMGYMEGNVVKYISRWRKKNGIADLEKAKHYIELLIDLESRKADEECKGA